MDAETLLTTTRAVRRRLDLARPVSRDVVEECVRVAVQAPSGGNRHPYRFMLVDDVDRRRELGAIYARAFEEYRRSPAVAEDPKIFASAAYLAEHLAEVPVLVVPCMPGRAESRTTTREQSGYWGSIYPAVWSFMLAARARGLGTALTTMHLRFELETAGVLEIPFESVTQVCLIPVAYAIGDSFRPARRGRSFVKWNSWFSLET